MLTRTYTALTAEKSYSRLHSITAGMSVDVPQLAVAIRFHVETNLLRYAAVQRVMAREFSMPVTELPALLDEYRWPSVSSAAAPTLH